jgi:hypothetical protein
MLEVQRARVVDIYFLNDEKVAYKHGRKTVDLGEAYWRGI